MARRRVRAGRLGGVFVRTVSGRDRDLDDVYLWWQAFAPAYAQFVGVGFPGCACASSPPAKLVVDEFEHLDYRFAGPEPWQRRVDRKDFVPLGGLLFVVPGDFRGFGVDVAR